MELSPAAASPLPFGEVIDLRCAQLAVLAALAETRGDQRRLALFARLAGLEDRP
jgi:hypothetical protein